GTADQVNRLTCARCCPSYLFQFLQMQRTDHLSIERVRHTRESPDVVHVVCLPFMLDSKLNTRAGVQRIKVPDQVLFGQEYLAHIGRSFRTRNVCPPLYRPPCPQTEGDPDRELSGITTKRVIEAMTKRPQAGVY